MPTPSSVARRRLVVAGFYLLPILALMFSFGAGYVMGQMDALTGVRPLPSLLRQAGLSAVADDVSLVSATPEAMSPEDQQRFRPLWEAWGLVNREFYDQPRLNRQEMVYGAVRGMLQTLDDPATLFLDPKAAELANADLRQTFDGIGVQVDLRDGKLTIVAPLPGSAGERAGLKPGDVISRVDGTDLAGKSLNDAVVMIRGPRGSTVVLTVLRAGEAQPLTFEVQREPIKVPSVQSRMVDESVAYVQVRSFGSDTGSETKQALEELLPNHPRGVVLDLRSNPGGYVNSAVDVASQFLGHGVVLYQQPGNGERETINATGGGLATDLPVVVLVNGGSASASEIVAAALRDNGRAKLVGQKTFGKGTVQTVHTLSDQSMLRVTMAQWLTPNAQPIHGRGLDPDLSVVQPDQLAPGDDPQLSAAVRVLEAGA